METEIDLKLARVQEKMDAAEVGSVEHDQWRLIKNELLERKGQMSKMHVAQDSVCESCEG